MSIRSRRNLDGKEATWALELSGDCLVADHQSQYAKAGSPKPKAELAPSLSRPRPFSFCLSLEQLHQIVHVGRIHSSELARSLWKSSMIYRCASGPPPPATNLKRLLPSSQSPPITSDNPSTASTASSRGSWLLSLCKDGEFEHVFLVEQWQLFTDVVLQVTRLGINFVYTLSQPLRLSCKEPKHLTKYPPNYQQLSC